MTDALSEVGRVLAEPLSYRFMVSALEAGTIVALVAGAVGYFMVLRRQSFAGHALAVVGFPGAAGAALLGLPALWGYLVFSVTAALSLAVLPGGGTRAQSSAVTGTIQALALASGFAFASLYRGFLGGVSAVLFGSFLGVTAAQVIQLAVVGALALAALAVVARPLLFASLDPQVALARGVPVRAISVVFLAVLAVAAAEASQITGTLLVFALLVAPAAAAQQFTARPWRGLALSMAIGVGVTWVGLLVAYWLPVPVGFAITTLAFALYLTSRAVARSTS